MKLCWKRITALTLTLLLCVVVVAGCSQEAKEPTAPPSVSAAASPAKTPKPAATVTPTATPPAELHEGMQGAEVAALQQRLVKLGYLAGKATDYFGYETKSALAAFQSQNGLRGDGIAGEKTLTLLNSDKAKKCDPFSLLAPTVNMSFEELVMSDDGTRDEYPKGYPALGTYKIVVDIEHQVTMVYAKDENGDYTIPVRYMLCSTGKNDCTPKGTFQMDKYHVRFSQFVRDKTYGQYWTQIKGAIYFHTILYSEFDTSTYIEEVWDKLGTADSHGCIRLTVPDAKWMWFHIAPGTTCVIRDGDSGDEQTAAIRKQLVLAPAPRERPDIEPSAIPNTDNWRIDDLPRDVPFEQGSQN